MTTNDGCRADVRKARAEAARVDPTAAAVRAAQAEAWDEGFQDGRRQDAEGDDGPRFINPYRADRLATDTAAPEGTCDAVEVQSQARCHKPSGHDGPHNGWAHYPGQLATWTTPAAPVAVEGVETVEWGVRFGPGDYGVRWNPGYGFGVYEPYTEAEARADSAQTGYPLVRRTRVEFEDRVSEWSPVEPETSEPEGGESA